MSLTEEVALAIATEFARASGVRVSGRLGFGFDGYVFRTGRGTAVKVFASEQKYQTERSVYERLNRLKVRIVRDLSNIDAFVARWHELHQPHVIAWRSAIEQGGTISTEAGGDDEESAHISMNAAVLQALRDLIRSNDSG